MNTITPHILAAERLSTMLGGGLVGQIFALLIVGLCLLCIYAVGVWFIKRLAGESPFVRTVWDGFFILIGLVVVLNFLMGLLGRGFIPW